MNVACCLGRDVEKLDVVSCLIWVIAEIKVGKIFENFPNFPAQILNTLAKNHYIKCDSIKKWHNLSNRFEKKNVIN